MLWRETNGSMECAGNTGRDVKTQFCVVCMQVGLKKYSSVSPTAFGLVGKKRLAVIRAAGAIVGGSGGSP